MPADILSLYPEVFGRLKGVKPHAGNTKATALCPAHDDHNRSLGLSIGREDRLLVKCGAGCRTEAVVAAIGLKIGDLFAKPLEKREEAQSIETVYPYTDEHGEILYECVRLKPKGFYYRRPDGKGGWIKNIDGCRRVPFGYYEILAAHEQETLCIVEGEKKAALMRFLGFLGTCNPGGAGKWPVSFAQMIQGRPVAIFPDQDEPGWQHALAVAKVMATTNGPIRIVELPGLRLKEDVCDWYARCEGSAPDLIRAAIDAAPIWDDDGDSKLRLQHLKMGIAKLLTLGHYI
jgi:putative DNA primase/helicase